MILVLNGALSCQRSTSSEQLAPSTTLTKAAPGASPSVGGGRAAGSVAPPGSTGLNAEMGSGALAIGDTAPDFQLSQLGAQSPSESLRLSGLRGNVVALYFWASWCVGCRIQGPAMRQIAEQFANAPVKVLGINADDSFERAKLANQKHAYNFPSVFDAERVVQRAYGVRQMPSVVILDARRRVRYVAKRMVGASKVAAEIQAALSN